MTHTQTQAENAEARFAEVFQNLGSIVRYAAARGSRDPEGIAAEVMTIAWRRLPSLPSDDPRPWLFVTARNLLMAEWRRYRPHSQLDEAAIDPRYPLAPDTSDPLVGSALRALSPGEREVLLLVAWDDLTPAQGAKALGISAVAFRVRLLRARRRFRHFMERHEGANDHSRIVEMESA
jgi:RNA polymerase sigma factor (sigma-70 family)